MPTGTLDLDFQARNGMTRLVHQRFSGLLRASRPVYRRSRIAPEVQIIHLGPGNMNGDIYQQRIQLGPDAVASIGYQSFSRVLPGLYGSSQTTTISLQSGSLLRMGSNVVSPFSQSKYVSTTDIYLAASAAAFIPEILLTRQEKEVASLDILRLKSTLRVFQRDRLVLRDCLDVGRESLTGARAWTRGYPVLGNLYMLGIPEASEPLFQQICAEARRPILRAGVSVIEGTGLVMRMLGSRVQDIQDMMNRAAEVYEQVRESPSDEPL